MKKQKDNQANLRPPIVTILGHVDHGKTTLLDAIRSSNVAAGEVGGITQGIGASEVTTKDGYKITFIDTPGHAAFSSMRERGAKIADIAVLVIAADDGFKPQTKEALEYINKTKAPFVVAVTKIDLKTASVAKVKKDLVASGVKIEGSGGDVPLVEVSGKTKKGLDNLLEMITLMSQLLDIKDEKDQGLLAYVIETNKDKRGPIVSIAVKRGSLNIGDEIYSGEKKVKVRGMFDHLGNQTKMVDSGQATAILGFKELPAVGSKITKEKQVGDTNAPKIREKIEIEEGQITAVVKAGSAGALEAVLANLNEDVVVIATGTGEVNDKDIFLAKSCDPIAYVFAFDTKVGRSTKKLAETEDVKIEEFNIIYKLLEKVDEIIKSGQTEIKGQAEVLASFPFNKKRVAGSKMVTGEMNNGDKIVLFRGDDEIGEAKVVSMRKGKTEVKNVKQGEEFGAILSPQLDFKEGDMIISLRK